MFLPHADLSLNSHADLTNLTEDTSLTPVFVDFVE